MVRHFSKSGDFCYVSPVFYRQGCLSRRSEDCCLSRGPNSVNRHLCTKLGQKPSCRSETIVREKKPAISESMYSLPLSPQFPHQQQPAATRLRYLTYYIQRYHRNPKRTLALARRASVGLLAPCKGIVEYNDHFTKDVRPLGQINALLAVLMCWYYSGYHLFL